jgi:hypothetical protein
MAAMWFFFQGIGIILQMEVQAKGEKLKARDENSLGEKEISKMQRTGQFWKFFRCSDGDAFFSAGFAGNEFAGRFTDCKLVGDKSQQMLVGFAVDGRGLDPEF